MIWEFSLEDEEEKWDAIFTCSISLYILRWTVNCLSIMIIVSKQTSEKKQTKRDTNCCWWPLWEYLCMWGEREPLFPFFFTPRVLMALGKECAREDYMNGSISITASIRQKKKYVVTTDMINCSSPSLPSFSDSFDSYVFSRSRFSVLEVD